MTDKSARPQDGDEVSPKIDPALNSNTEKEPDAGLLPQNPLGGIRRARGFETNLTKAEASKRIDALKSKRELVQTDKSR